MSRFPEKWMTNEPAPRTLTVKGRSGLDPDVLVAYFEGDEKPQWIVENSGYVCGLNGVRAAVFDNYS